MRFEVRKGDIKLFIGLIGSLLILLLFLFNLLKPLELLSYDFYQRIKPERVSHPQIAIIEIADDGIQAFGRWPWDRKYHGALVSILAGLSVEAVLFDILFSEAAEPQDDKIFEVALKQNPVAYLPYAFEAVKDNGKIHYETQYRPIEQFRPWVKGSGHINIESDDDGVNRQFSLIIEREGEIYPSISFQACLDHWGVSFEDVVIRKGKWIEVPLPDEKNMRIPIDKRYRTWINWVGRWESTFKHYSFVDIIRSFKQVKEGIEPVIDLEEFKDKICLVGLTAIGLSDIKIIPLQPIYPGIGVHANVIQSILEGKFITPMGKGVNALLVLFLGFLTSFSLFRKKTALSMIFIIGLFVVYIAISFVLLCFYGIWISLVAPLLSILTNFIFATLYSEVQLAIEKKKLFKLATRDGLTGLFNIRHFTLFLDAEVQKWQHKNAKPFSVIMSDIDHFKKFNDTYGHQVGDLVLRECAKSFRLSVRELDIVGRYGGEEFIILLPETPLEEAMPVAERVRKNIELRPIKDGKNNYKVTISLGVACFTGKESKSGELVKRADAALYEAKDGGRNKVCPSKNL